MLVFVEGRSDAAVVTTLLRARGLVGSDTRDPGETGETGAPSDDAGSAAPGEVRVVAMGGVTNLGHHLPSVDDNGRLEVVGLYDAGEAAVVVRALRRHGLPVSEVNDLERLGFFCCTRDLEDELVRAVGVPAVEASLSRLGLRASFRTFVNQPQWRGRDPVDQLRRFVGAGSGRKLRVATELASLLDEQSTPTPLRMLVDTVAELVESSGSVRSTGSPQEGDDRRGSC